jgi:hypothetical protein
MPNKLPDISDWPDRVSDDRLPLGFMPEQMRQAEERNKALRDFTLIHNSQADMLVRCMLKPFYN